MEVHHEPLEPPPKTASFAYQVLDNTFCGCIPWCKQPASPCCSPAISRRALLGAFLLATVTCAAVGLRILENSIISDTQASEGSASVAIPTLPPLPPRNLGVSAVGYDFLELHWKEGAPDPGAKARKKKSGKSGHSPEIPGKNEGGESDSYTVWISGPLPLSAASKQPNSIVYDRMLGAEKKGKGGGVKIDGLQAGQAYCVEVCGENAAGQGDTSVPMCFATLSPKPPLAPGAPR
eukprot:957662-Amorphochlora_amoeboformis.AAC.1